MSKIPPQLRQSLTALLQSATAFALRHFDQPLEDFLAGTQHFVQCFLEVGGALRELLPYLSNILFKALLDLLPEELLESSVAESFGVLRGVISDDVRNQCPGQPLRPLIRVPGEKWVERTSCDSTGAAYRRRRRHGRCGCGSLGSGSR